jgi:hypothetical protein
MPIERLARTALLLALLGLPAAAKDANMPSKTPDNGLFSGQIPDAWRRKDLAEGGTGYFFTDGQSSIRVERLDKDPGLKPLADVSVSTVSAAGRTCDLYRRQFQARTGGDEGRGRAQWVYEETVIVPDKGVFWELKYRRTSAARHAAPAAGDVWKIFLKSFRPVKRV